MNKKMIEQELQTVKGLQSVAEDAVEIKRFFILNILWRGW